MKLLHSADWHLCAPLTGRAPEQAALLRRELEVLPGRVVAAAKAEGCELILLSGDLFDGPPDRASLARVQAALARAEMPVFIAPGNHDHAATAGLWETGWPENVHIFTQPRMTSVGLPRLSCRVYGGAFTAPASPGLLEGFRAEGDERFAVGVLHGDPTGAASPYCPVTALQVQESGLDYLALGHIHKGGSLRAGATLCAWPGCPMGRGFDETGEKGVLIVTLGGQAEARFLPIPGPRFYDWTLPGEDDPVRAVSRVLPAAGNSDFYRVTLTGECPEGRTARLSDAFPQFPHLEFRDETVPPADLWENAGEDSLEGVYFGLLRDALEHAEGDAARQILLAAKLSRRILQGQEVALE